MEKMASRHVPEDNSRTLPSQLRDPSPIFREITTSRLGPLHEGHLNVFLIKIETFKLIQIDMDTIYHHFRISDDL